MAVMKPDLTITTCKILSLAYCMIFDIVTDPGTGIGHYYGQHVSPETCVDYAHFDTLDYDTVFDDDTDYFEAATEDGSEGCWIRVDLLRYHADTRSYTRKRVGTIKTLSEGAQAWRDMGQLAGHLAYLANNDALRKIAKHAKELAAENVKED